MLEGLEISEIRLSEIKAKTRDFRIEAEHYQHKYQLLINKLNVLNCSYLRTLVSKPIQTGHTPSMKDSRFYGGDIKFVKTDNLRDNEIKEPFTNYLSDLGNSEIKRTELQEKDIITTIIGATYDVIARSCIVQKSLLPANINQNIAHIRPDVTKISPEYLNVYLNSKYGKMYLEYLSRQMEQVNLNCEEVGMVKVPLLSSDFQSKIETLVKSAHERLEESKSLYAQAENLLLSELGMSNPPENFGSCGGANVSIKRFSDVFQSGRLDSEYYQKKYDLIEEKISHFETLRISEIGKLNDKNFSPKENAEYKYIELADIGGQGEISSCTVSKGSELPTRARRIVHKGDVLVSSIEGSLQSCAIVSAEFDGALCSTGFYVIEPETMNAETLLILLKSENIQLLLKKGCSGTILTNISKDEFLKIRIPILPSEIQSKIASLVQSSFVCRAESRWLLQNAKTLVEQEIEKQGEK